MTLLNTLAAVRNAWRTQPTYYTIFFSQRYRTRSSPATNLTCSKRAPYGYGRYASGSTLPSGSLTLFSITSSGIEPSSSMSLLTVTSL